MCRSRSSSHPRRPAADGSAELWVGGRLFASTRISEDLRLLIEINEGPWELEVEGLHRALERIE